MIEQPSSLAGDSLTGKTNKHCFMEMGYFGADHLILHPFLFSVPFVILVSPAVFPSIVTFYFLSEMGPTEMSL